MSEPANVKIDCGDGIGCAAVILAICCFILTLNYIGCIQNEPKAHVEAEE